MILAELRQAANMTQEDMAERIGVSRQAVAKWELGKSTPDLAKLIALADFFDVSLDKLTGREESNYDKIKAKLEALSAKPRREDDVLPMIRRFMDYSEGLGLTKEQVVKGIQYMCED